MPGQTQPISKFDVPVGMICSAAIYDEAEQPPSKQDLSRILTVSSWKLVTESFRDAARKLITSKYGNGREVV